MKTLLPFWCLSRVWDYGLLASPPVFAAVYKGRTNFFCSHIRHTGATEWSVFWQSSLFATILISILSVSYTHLDVYKRQVTVEQIVMKKEEDTSAACWSAHFLLSFRSQLLLTFKLNLLIKKSFNCVTISSALDREIVFIFYYNFMKNLLMQM